MSPPISRDKHEKGPIPFVELSRNFPEDLTEIVKNEKEIERLSYVSDYLKGHLSFMKLGFRDLFTMGCCPSIDDMVTDSLPLHIAYAKTIMNVLDYPEYLSYDYRIELAMNGKMFFISVIIADSEKERVRTLFDTFGMHETSSNEAHSNGVYSTIWRGTIPQDTFVNILTRHDEIESIGKVMGYPQILDMETAKRDGIRVIEVYKGMIASHSMVTPEFVEDGCLSQFIDERMKCISCDDYYGISLNDKVYFRSHDWIS